MSNHQLVALLVDEPLALPVDVGVGVGLLIDPGLFDDALNRQF
jgi:hypothetical protein